jgi:hypothetical protein
MINDKKMVWVETYGCYSEYSIVAVFSTKEKAYNYYNMHQIIDPELNEPEEFPLDNAVEPVYVHASKYKNDEWTFREWEDYTEELLDRDRDFVFVKISFNPDKSVMEKAANDRLAFLKAQKACIV